MSPEISERAFAERGYPFKAFVAFSGTAQDGGQAYTESNMNGFPEAQTTRTFEHPDYRFLIVANKFQTGFHQPLLHTMYVDKKLVFARHLRRLLPADREALLREVQQNIDMESYRIQQTEDRAGAQARYPRAHGHQGPPPHRARGTGDALTPSSRSSTSASI
jgi:hypothetical protein